MIPRMDSRSLPYLLHTRLYQAFCLEYAGRIIHHAPSLGDGSTACEEECKAPPDTQCRSTDGKPMTREAFASLYQQAFGEAPCATIWFPETSPEKPSSSAHVAC